jgi:hypothetical protein
MNNLVRVTSSSRIASATVWMIVLAGVGGAVPPIEDGTVDGGEVGPLRDRGVAGV